MRLDDLVNINGVVFACEFTADGKCSDYRAKTDIPREMADKAAEYIATVTMMFNTLAGSFTNVSRMQWVPQRGWTYTGGDWTTVIRGNRAIFAETARINVDEVSRMLSGEGVIERVEGSI